MIDLRVKTICDMFSFCLLESDSQLRFPSHGLETRAGPRGRGWGMRRARIQMPGKEGRAAGKALDRVSGCLGKDNKGTNCMGKTALIQK